MPYDILIPTMTGATSPSGVASAKNDFSVGYEAWRAFDRNTGTLWSAASDPALPCWLRYQFAGPVDAREYSITPWSGYLDRAPHDFKLQGSNNGTDWTDLDSQTDINMSFQKYTYTLAAPATYSYFQLLVSAANGSPYLAVTELELAGYPAQSPFCYLHGRRNRLDVRGVSTQNALA
jgi:hypothetical protein